MNRDRFDMVNELTEEFQLNDYSRDWDIVEYEFEKFMETLRKIKNR